MKHDSLPRMFPGPGNRTVDTMRLPHQQNDPSGKCNFAITAGSGMMLLLDNR